MSMSACHNCSTICDTDFNVEGWITDKDGNDIYLCPPCLVKHDEMIDADLKACAEAEDREAASQHSSR